MVDISKLPPLGLGQSAPAGPAVQPYGYLRGLWEEALYETGLGKLGGKPISLFLEDPDPQLAAWEAQNPGSDIATTLASFLVPYTGQVKAGGLLVKGGAKVLPQLAKLNTFVEGASKAPGVLKPWAAESIKLAAGEPLKLGLAAAGAPEGTSLGEIAAYDALGQVAGLGVMGALRGVRQGVKSLAPWVPPSKKMSDLLPEFPVNGAIQDQLSYLYNNLPSVQTQDNPWVQAHINQLERQVLAQQARGAKYVGPLTSGADTKEINQLFQLRAVEGLNKRQFIVHPSAGFASRSEADTALASVGLPAQWGRHTQFPRLLEAANKSKAKAVQKTIGKNLSPTANGWFVGEEAENGLYVLARKLRGDPGKGTAGDQWVMLKTSEPNAIVGRDVITRQAEKQANFATGLRNRLEAQGLKDLPEDSFPKIVQKLKKTFTPAVMAGRGVDGVLGKVGGPGAVANMKQALANATEQERGAAGAGWEFVRDKIVPAQREFVGKPLAEQVRLMVQGIADTARAKSSAVLFGKQGLSEDKNIYRRLIQTDKPQGLQGLVSGLKEEDMPFVNQILLAEVEPKDLEGALAALKANPDQMRRVANLFKELQKADDTLMAETREVQKAYGEDALKAAPAHYLVSHTWRGNWRHRVLNERGQTVAMGAGYSRDEAVQAAKKLASDYGMAVDNKGPFLSNFEEDQKLYNSILTRQRGLMDRKARKLGMEPFQFRLRQGVLGFMGSDKPLSKKELFDIISGTVSTRYKYLAEQSIKHQVMPDAIEVWHRYGPKVFNALAYRINQNFGIKGPVNKLINQTVDKALAPLFGRNSADRLVRAYNAAEMQLTLLSYNLAHPVMNALTFLQTVLPKAAFVMGAEPQSLQKVLGYMPALDLQGRPKGISAVFEPLKLAAISFKDMAKPDKELRSIFDRAASEGVITAGLQEHYIGENSQAGKWVGDRLDLGDVWDKLSSSPFLNPARKSEELSRAHALVVGKNLGQVLGIKDSEALYQFAKQFTHRTMYQYTTADRPKLFNGPIGSLFGLFKNWTAHYISDMALYVDEALRRKQVAPLLWSLGGQGLLAGAGGTLAYGMADQMSRWTTDKPLMDHIYSSLGSAGVSPETSDVLFYGAPALFGVSLQANASAPFSNPIKDISYLTNFALFERAKKVGAAYDYFSQQLGAGRNPLENEQTWDKMAYALAPRVLYKSLAQIEDGALKAASNGQPIITGLGAGDFYKNAFGFTPTDIAKAYTLQDEIFTKKENLAAQTSALGEAFYQAWRASDVKGMTEVLRAAILQGASLPNVMRSAKVRMNAGLLPELDRSLWRDPEALIRAQALGVAPTPTGA